MQPSRFSSIGAMSEVKELLQFSGCWPPSDSNLRTKITGIYSVVGLTVFSITILIKVFSDITDFESVSFGMVCALAALNCLAKYNVVLLNEKSFLNVIEHLKNFHFTSHSSELDIYLETNIKTSTRIRTMFRASGVGLFIIIIGSPFLISLENRPLPIPFPIDVKEKPLWIYLLAWYIQITGSGVIAYTTPCYDVCILNLMVLASGQLRILQEKIILAIKDLNNNEMSPCVDLDYNIKINALKGCIGHHIAIERFITLIEDTFMFSFLIQMLVSLIITCFVGFNLVLLPLLSLQFGRTALFFAAILAELSMFCIPGNEIILESEKIRDACYTSNWHDCDLHIQKLLYLIMERAKRPLILTAAKFVSLSLSTLLSITRSSFSYFMVIWQMYRNAGKSV